MQVTNLAEADCESADRFARSSTGLLVSVRSSEEARIALAAGVDVLDVKEPAHGSLGMASLSIIGDIASELTNSAPRTSSTCPQLSVALGEVCDWDTDRSPDITQATRDQWQVPQLPPEVRFAKLGLAGLLGSNSRVADWCDRWRQIREQFDAARLAAGFAPLQWVAVAYADADRAAAPPWLEVLEAGRASGCVGLLIDTYDKSGPQLLEHLDLPELRVCRERTSSAGLFLALAGRLTWASLDAVRSIGPDLIAVRSLACAEQDRAQGICPVALQQLRSVIGRKTACGLE